MTRCPLQKLKIFVGASRDVVSGINAKQERHDIQENRQYVQMDHITGQCIDDNLQCHTGIGDRQLYYNKVGSFHVEIAR